MVRRADPLHFLAETEVWEETLVPNVDCHHACFLPALRPLWSKQEGAM